MDIQSIKKVIGIGPKTMEEAEADFNKQKRSDAVGWSNECDKNIKTITKCLKVIEENHKALIENRYQMEAAIGRNFRRECSTTPRVIISDEVNTRFLDLKAFKQAVKVVGAKGKVKEEAEALLVAQ